MRILTEEDEQPTIAMAPLIDIVFLLIIFFLVVSEIASYDRIDNLVLPVADEAQPENILPERLIISVDTFNDIYVGGRKRTLEDLETLLRLEKKYSGETGGRTKQPILIQADQDARWEVVQDILETAGRLKFWRISFSARKEG